MGGGGREGTHPCRGGFVTDAAARVGVGVPLPEIPAGKAGAIIGTCIF